VKHKRAWAIFLLCLACSPKNSGVGPAGADAKTAILPEWFSGGKFGMFIHWGPYSVLGGEWNGKRIEQGDIAEWIMQRFEIPVAEYRKVAATFNPARFHAREWVALAKNAGMKYLVITAKHHKVSAGKEQITGTVRSSRGWYEYKTEKIGRIRVS